MQVVFSLAAEADLDEIWLNIAFGSPRAADKVLDSIRDRTAQLCDFPELAQSRPDIAVGIRVLTEGNYLILYRLTDRLIEIIRVIHGARDLTTLF